MQNVSCRKLLVVLVWKHCCSDSIMIISLLRVWSETFISCSLFTTGSSRLICCARFCTPSSSGLCLQARSLRWPWSVFRIVLGFSRLRNSVCLMLRSVSVEQSFSLRWWTLLSKFSELLTFKYFAWAILSLWNRASLFSTSQSCDSSRLTT